ncbi:MAG: alpha/beta hydrolase [Elusimicrobia bacterium]|nr:alpha/beta hydrolase [Elusimicrobiota bacterium]
MTVLWIVLALLALAALLMAAGWYGAGVILYPPKKSPLLTFPEFYGLPYEKVSFATSDGLTLKGWFLPSQTGEDRTLIMCHGWGDNKGYLLERSYFLSKEAGFNILYFDNRSHGESEGDVTTIGCLETVDFEAAISFLKKNRPSSLNRLGVFGMSMGAAVAILSMPKHPEVKAAVFESPFPDYRNVVRRWAWNNLRIPYFPLILVTLYMLRWRVGIPEVDAYSPIAFIRKIAPRPIFVIGGAQDLLMPQEDVEALYERAEQPKSLWIVPGAAHGECRAKAQVEYEARVATFFRTHL